MRSTTSDYVSGHSDVIPRPANLVELLRWRAAEHPERRAFTYLVNGEESELHLTFEELDEQARAIGALLQSRGISGERVLLMYPPGLEFVAAFFGCMYGGAIAVPAPPLDRARANRTLERVRSIVKDAQPRVVLTTSSLLSGVESWVAQDPEMRAMQWLSTDSLDSDLLGAWREPTVQSDALAFLQYTSGSTAVPKGVMVGHANLLHNSEYIRRAWGYLPESVSAIWVPNFHDDGLVHGTIQPIYSGFHCLLLPPLVLVQRPIRWLRVISRYRVTHSGGPNFAYALCVRKIMPKECDSLDLSCWRVAYNAAEPIRKETLEQFAETFGPFGFRWDAFYPAYGLAESTLLVSTRRKIDQPRFCTVDSEALEHQGRIVAAVEERGSRTLVGCGYPVLETKTLIVNPDTLTRCEPNEVGEIWISDPSVAQGYWQQPEETDRTFHAVLAKTGEGPFLRTGDLGFLKNGELFVAGRLKDLIIIRGRNLYPQDIELTVERSHNALRAGCGAAFSVEVEGEERLVVAQEVEEQGQSNHDQIIESISQAVAEEHEIQVYAVALIKAKTIPKTSSGKIQRRACRAEFLSGGLTQLKTRVFDRAVNLERQPEPELLVSASPGENATAQDRSRERTDDLINWLRSYADERINSRLIDERRCIPPHIVLDLGNHGVLGMQVPEAFGGIALKNRDAMRVLEQLAAIDLTLASFVSGNNTLGIRPIQRYATKGLRDELLPILAKGRELAAFALTEPGAGSNPRAISSTAVADAQGGWRLRGTKIWSGSSAWSGAINVFVQLAGADGDSSRLTGFVVRQGTKGLRLGPEAISMGMRGMVQNVIHLEDVVVGPINLLGQPGEGMEAAQDAMMFGRLCLGAMSVGGMKRCAQLMLRYGLRRSVATGRLIDNPVTLARMSELTAAITAVETLVARLAELLDEGQSIPVEAFIACKIAGPEFLWRAADDLVQLLGGRGYIETNIAPQLLRDARLFRIFEGPTEALNMFLGTSVGRARKELHDFLRHSLQAPSVSARLLRASEQINERYAQPSSTFPDRSSALRWSYVRNGEIGVYAFLLAAVQQAFERRPSGHLRRVVEWALLRFEETLAAALRTTATERALVSTSSITELVSGFAREIGDVEQTLAGDDQTLDWLLRREAPTPSAVVQINVPEGASLEHETSEGMQVSSSPLQAEAANLNSGVANEREAARPGDEAQNTGPESAPFTPETIEGWLVRWLERQVGASISPIEWRKPFAQYGLDSVSAVMLSDELGTWLRRSLPATLAYDYPNIEALVSHLTSPPKTEELLLAAEKLGESEVELLLTQLEQLSPEEARAALDLERESNQGGGLGE